MRWQVLGLVKMKSLEYQWRRRLREKGKQARQLELAASDSVHCGDSAYSAGCTRLQSQGVRGRFEYPLILAFC